MQWLPEWLPADQAEGRPLVIDRMLDVIVGGQFSILRFSSRCACTLLFTLSLLLSSTSVWATTVTLNFSSLPSAQGWTYFSDGAPEASIFSVSGGVLTQHTETFAGAATIQGYDLFGAVSLSLPFTISVRARVLADSSTGFGINSFGFCFFANTGPEIFGVGLEAIGRIGDINNVVVSTAIDTKVFHDYRLVATPGVGYQLFVDDVLVATGPPRISGGSSVLRLGDCTRGQGALAEVTAYSFRQFIPVGIDIKPRSFPNSINPRSQGVIPVAILTSATFNASTVSPSTVKFGPSGASPRSPGSLNDVDGDGDLDLVLHFDTQQTGIQCGQTQAKLTGKTFSGQDIEGSDSIVTVGCP